jgi:hypothetical protein
MHPAHKVELVSGDIRILELVLFSNGVSIMNPKGSASQGAREAVLPQATL